VLVRGKHKPELAPPYVDMALLNILGFLRVVGCPTILLCLECSVINSSPYVH
jgi:hypothetical protein